MKKVCIITNFKSADEAYSLNRVVINQIKMFTSAGYKIKVIVAEGFKPEDWYANPLVEVYEIPDVPVSNELGIDKTFDEDIDKLKVAFEEILKDVDVAITHDVVYQPASIKHNLALRSLLQEKKIDLHFLHWIHSATQPAILSGIQGGSSVYKSLIETRFPNSFYIAFNEYSVPRIAKWFKIEEDDVKYVPHPHDFYEYKDVQTVLIAHSLNLLSKDVVCMYPCRLDRGKQPHMVVEIMAQVKKNGRSVCLIIPDFHSTDGDKVKYREEMKTLGLDLGLNDKELVFLSDFLGKDKPAYEVKHQVIQELFGFTNVFILPSRSETYSLVAQEAMANRNFLVLNQDFPPFRSIYGDSPLYKQFSSNMDSQSGGDGETNVRYENEMEYMNDIAKYICYAQEHTRVLVGFNKIRQQRNLKYVFQHNIEPLLHGEPSKYNY